MPAETQWWSCPNCELPCPMQQDQCGACGEYRSDDVGSLTVRSLFRYVADAIFFKPERK